MTDSSAWFRWRHNHPHEAEDPSSAFAAGVRIGRQQMLEASVEWAQLAPLLGSLLEEIAQMREERDVERRAHELEPAF